MTDTQPSPRSVLVDMKKKLLQQVAQIDAAIAAFDSFVPMSNVAEKTVEQVHVNLERRPSNSMPISAAIVRAVQQGCMAPAQIKANLRDHGILTTSASINTRLYKLKAEKKIRHDADGWKPVYSLSTDTTWIDTESSTLSGSSTIAESGWGKAIK